MIPKLVESLSGVRFIAEPHTKVELENLIAGYTHGFQEVMCETAPNPYMVIGSDTRPAVDAIREWIIRNSYVPIIDAGIVTTPELEEAVRHLWAAGGIMITASHNPEEYCGIKMMGPTGMILAPQDLQKVMEAKQAFDPEANHQNRPSVSHFPSAEHYADFIINCIGGEQAVAAIADHFTHSTDRIFVDPNGGSAIGVLDVLMRKTGIPFERLNFEYGQFNREIEPSERSLSSRW
jgi:phosphomannomutase